jgi:DNA mismatch repair ATPase MutL
MISKAISDAYNRFISHSSFPAYVLNLEVDPTSVDVNVHPRKLEVRFENEQNIFRAVYHAIEEKLNSVSLINSGQISSSPNEERLKSPPCPLNEGEQLNSYPPRGGEIQLSPPRGGGQGGVEGQGKSPKFYT